MLQTTGIDSGTEERRKLQYGFPYRIRNLNLAGAEHTSDHWHRLRDGGMKRTKICFSS
jgi:hypothetical protein